MEQVLRDTALQLFLDKEAIKEVHIRYCRGIDRMDLELVRSCYHPDAIDDHGEFVGGPDAFIDYCRAGIPTFEHTAHFTGNQYVEVEGDTAWAEHYARCYHRIAATPERPAYDQLANARYVDRFERRDGEWKILKRTIIVDTCSSMELGEQWSPPELLRGRRDRSDPSYER